MKTTDPRDPLYFAALELEGVRCFRERIRLDFTGDDGKPSMWNVILGENGTGKTTALLLLCALLPTKSSIHTDAGQQDYYISSFNNDVNRWMPIFGHAAFRPNERELTFASVRGQVLKTGLKCTERKDTSSAWMNYGYAEVYEQHPPVFTYGAHRPPTEVDLSSERASNPFSTLTAVDGALPNPEEWLLRAELAALIEQREQADGPATKRRDAVVETIVSLLPDVESIVVAAGLSQPPTSSLQRLVFVTTNGERVPLRDLSLGYRTIAALAVDLASRLFDAYPDSDDPLREPCIVLIDEIDLHLHPRWQRTVVSYFRERFPKAQFIVTTHSPLVVQASGEDANLILLRRNDRGAVEVVNDPHLVSAWRVDQLLTSELFGLSSARPPHVEEQLDERARLVALDDRTSEEEARLQALHERASALPTSEDPTAPDDGLELLFELAEQILQNREAAHNAPLASDSPPEPYATEDQPTEDPG